MRSKSIKYKTAVHTVVYRLIAVILLVSLVGCFPHTPVEAPDSKDAWQDVPFWAAEIGGMAQRFELAKRTEPELIVFLRRMPKGADLHNHVSGAAYAEFNLASAYEKGMNYDLRTNVFTREELKPNTIISTEELATNPEYRSQFLDTVSMRGWYPSTSNGHDHFFQTFNHFGDERSREDMLVEIVKRNYYQQVQYLELMTRSAPKSINRELRAVLGDDFRIDDLEASYARLAPLVNRLSTKAAINAYLDEREQYVQAQLSAQTEISITGREPDIILRYISQLKRLGSLSSFFVEALVAITAINVDERVVALNIVAAEDDPRALHNFDAQMEILNFLWHKMGYPNFTLHSGELVLRESPVEPMWDRISQSIKKGRALRIGHGIAVAWEHNVVALLEYMRNNHILVEICLSSNASILGIAGNTHPFKLYQRAGVPMAICTDDEGISRSNLTMEFVRAVQSFDLDYDDVVTLARNSIAYSFLPGISLFIDHDYTKLRPEFDGLQKPEWQPNAAAAHLMESNPKLERQVKLERAFVEFKSFVNSGFK